MLDLNLNHNNSKFSSDLTQAYTAVSPRMFVCRCWVARQLNNDVFTLL